MSQKPSPTRPTPSSHGGAVEGRSGTGSAAPARVPDASEADDLRMVEAIRQAEAPGASAAVRAEAWSELLRAYQDRLYGVCLRMVRDHDTARDLTQDSFVKIIQGLDTFDGRARLSTWMIRVTMNVCLSHLRKAKLRRHASLDAGGPSGEAGAGGWGVASGAGIGRTGGSGGGMGLSAGGEPDILSRVESGEAQALVARALAKMDAEQRAILVLRDVRGLDYRDIAEALDVPLGTVKSRLFRAREALREAVESLAKGMGE